MEFKPEIAFYAAVGSLAMDFLPFFNSVMVRGKVLKKYKNPIVWLAVLVRAAFAIAFAHAANSQEPVNAMGIGAAWPIILTNGLKERFAQNGPSDSGDDYGTSKPKKPTPPPARKKVAKKG